MKKRTCELAGCDAPHKAKGMCTKHYTAAAKRARSPQVPDAPCMVTDCTRSASTVRGLCRGHSQFLYRYGSTTPTTEATRERFMKFVRIAETDCWEWTGARTGSRHQYGGFSLKATGRPTVQAHRVSWEIYRGPIPEGLEIDHLCRNTICCNPEHLEPVSHQVNVDRHTALVTHCKQGHPFDEANTRIGRVDGGRARRACRACAADRERKRRQRA